jgi:hypothetical protein
MKIFATNCHLFNGSFDVKKPVCIFQAFAQFVMTMLLLLLLLLTIV